MNIIVVLHFIVVIIEGRLHCYCLIVIFDRSTIERRFGNTFTLLDNWLDTLIITLVVIFVDESLGV